MSRADAQERAGLIAHLVGREFRLRYRRSALGWIWAVIVPMARLVVLAVVFTKIIPLEIENYTAFLYSGLLAWTWFSATLASTTTSVVDRSDLLLRPGLPKAAIPLTAAMGDLIDYLVALPLLLAWVAVDVGLTDATVALIPLVVAQLLFSLGIGYALAPAHVYLRDVARVVELALVIGFYMTPVFYPEEKLPADLRWVADFNPMAQLIDGHRTALVEGRFPDVTTMFGLLGLGAVTCAAGLVVFRHAAPRLVDEL